MSVFLNRMDLILNNGGINYGAKKFWKYLLLNLSLLIAIIILPGALNPIMIIGQCSIIHLLGNVITDKSNLLNSLSMSNNKKVVLIYQIMIVMITIYNFIIALMYFLFRYNKSTIDEVFQYRFESLEEFIAFLIAYLVLFFFMAPLCFIKKNGIWFAWFFGSNILFICIINLLKYISGLDSFIIIGSIILIPTIIISFKASCYFNRPKSYIPLQNQVKSITI